MLILLQSPASFEQLSKAGEDLDGYIKFVVDVQNETMTVGGLRHFEGEQLLLAQGSNQADLWGGGFDTQTQEIDFESMINIRPPINPSREVLSSLLRGQIEKLVVKFLKIGV